MSQKNLAIFDFDHTIIDLNSDIVIRDLIPTDDIPNNVKEQYKSDGWTAYMQGIFKLLHARKVGESVMKEIIEGILPLNGMDGLLMCLKRDYNTDSIIVSDSNSYFINTWLKKYKLESCVDGVFTNPAHFDENGLLNIEMYHLQTDCNLSTKNLCKGRIMEEYLEAQEKNGVIYDKIIYFGDGFNDICPILRLKKSDLACVRENYKCASSIRSIKQHKPIDSSGKIYYIKCNVFYFNCGDDILNHLKVFL
ncbi:probable phosphatase phospho2 isoform X2 [Onthophagus taurus]|nr:probable phosphatase phospho2 [Onthophagus taurus]XP_022919253.1 probable phosphatase phospho2 [Onthophagus taurus]